MAFRMRRILLPVTFLTWAMPCESRRMMPICDGVRPFLARRVMCSETSSGVIFNHDGGARLYGNDDLEIPLPPLCMRPMAAGVCSERRRLRAGKNGKRRLLRPEALLCCCWPRLRWATPPNAALALEMPPSRVANGMTSLVRGTLGSMVVSAARHSLLVCTLLSSFARSLLFVRSFVRLLACLVR